VTNQPNEDTVEREPKIVRMLFNDDMARAIVQGRKTATRRPPRHSIRQSTNFPGQWEASDNRDLWWNLSTDQLLAKFAPCAPGDILIGRECWRVFGGVALMSASTTGPAGIRPSSAARSSASGARSFTTCPTCRGWSARTEKWRPSSHMPDWAARIRRRVVSVTVERVQDITEEDAVREGIRRWTKDGSVYKYGHIEPGDIGCTPWVDMARTGRDAFARLWDSIYAAKGLGWDVNPWVWRIEFASENEPAA
jgi:hypothetical protein